MSPQPRPLAARFWSKVDINPDGCWMWTGARNNRGYGKIGPNGHDNWVLAHRVSWELAYGPIPDGLCVLHRCDNPPCVRPDHLFLGTITDNGQDASAKGRSWNQNMGKVSCIRGHPLAGANLYVAPDGKRQCRQCQRNRSRDWQKQHRKGGHRN